MLRIQKLSWLLHDGSIVPNKDLYRPFPVPKLAPKLTSVVMDVETGSNAASMFDAPPSEFAPCVMQVYVTDADIAKGVDEWNLVTKHPGVIPLERTYTTQYYWFVRIGGKTIEIPYIPRSFLMTVYNSDTQTTSQVEMLDLDEYDGKPFQIISAPTMPLDAEAKVVDIKVCRENRDRMKLHPMYRLGL